MGTLGRRVLETMGQFGFPLRGWSRTPKHIDGVDSFCGVEQLGAFLAGTRVLVCMLQHHSVALYCWCWCCYALI